MAGPAPYPPPPPPNGPSNNPSRLPTARQSLGILLLVVALVFIFENTHGVDVRLIVPEVHVPLFVALLIAAALGSLGTLLIQWRRHRKQ